MKNQLFLALSFSIFFHPACGLSDMSKEDESMARARRLFNSTFLEVSSSEVGQWQRDLRTVGPQDIESFKKLLEEEPGDYFTQNTVLSFITKIDGGNMCSTGDKDILEATRKFLTEKIDVPDWRFVEYSLLYLSQKGDSRDINLLNKYSKLPSKLPIIKNESVDCLRILQTRVSGTNVLEGLQTRYYTWSTNSPPFLPSVANAGPQAVYVYDLLKQALIKYGSPTNIPPEILSLTVSLDAQGKPVCSVDPTKYGLKLPTFVIKKETLPKQQKSEKNIKVTGVQSASSNANTKEKQKKCLSLPSVVTGVFAVGVVGLTVLFALRKMRC